MKVIDILDAKESLAKLNLVKFSDFKIVSSIYKLTKKVNNVLDMVQQEQKKIIDIYAKKDNNGKTIILNNMYQFEDEEKKNNFIKEMSDLKQQDIDDINKIDISMSKIQYGAELTGEELMKLEPLINWND